MTNRTSMTTTRAIDELKDKLADDIMKILEHARAEHRDRALHTVAALLGGAPKREVRGRAEEAKAKAKAKPAPKPAAKAATPPKPAKAEVAVATARPRLTRTEVASPQKASSRPEPAPAPKRRHPSPVAAAAPAASAPPAAPGAPVAEPSPTERETAVLEAVRLLVRATASEVAERCGLPNGTAYVVLRALCASRRVAKTETARGIEYALVSPGKIQPFKRTKGAPTTDESPAVEAAPASASTPADASPAPQVA
jgi:hypothetical protein